MVAMDGWVDGRSLKKKVANPATHGRSPLSLFTLVTLGCRRLGAGPSRLPRIALAPWLAWKATEATAHDVARPLLSARFPEMRGTSGRRRGGAEAPTSPPPHLPNRARREARESTASLRR